MNIWRLPCDHAVLSQLTLGETIAAVWVRRVFMRYHRDQVLDNRCFITDWLLWRFLSDTPWRPRLGAEEGMIQCQQFWTHRSANGPDTLPFGAIIDPDRWDEGLWAKDAEKPTDALVLLQETIRAHRDIDGRPRTTDDDRALYAALPEKLPADFRLPSEAEFLGEDGAPIAGCPSFWRSHAACNRGRCNQYRWGPCTMAGLT